MSTWCKLCSLKTQKHKLFLDQRRIRTRDIVIPRHHATLVLVVSHMSTVDSDPASCLYRIVKMYILFFNFGGDQESGRSGDRGSGIADPGDHFSTSQTRSHGQPGKLDLRIRRTSIRFVEVRAYPNSSNRFAGSPTCLTAAAFVPSFYRT